MEKFIFKIEAPKDEKDNFIDEVSLEFEGYEHELAAAFSFLGSKHEVIKAAILYAADYLRDEHRVKECLENHTTLN